MGDDQGEQTRILHRYQSTCTSSPATFGERSSEDYATTVDVATLGRWPDARGDVAEEFPGQGRSLMCSNSHVCEICLGSSTLVVFRGQSETHETTPF